MAIVVEDGTGKADAVSYLSVADADAYHTARGNTAWTGAAKEAALVKATDYLDRMFRYKGVKNSTEQALEWPRYNVFDRYGRLIPSDALPRELENATAELALSALSEDVMPDFAQGGGISSKSVTVGPISESTTYAPSTEQGKVYNKAKLSLKDYIEWGDSVDMVRA